MYGRDYSKFSVQSFRDDISIQNWDLNNNDSNLLMNDFLFKLSGCADRHAPIRKLNSKNIRFKAKPWISSNLIKMIRIRDNLFKRKKKQPNNERIKFLYNSFRNRINRELKKIP